MRELVDELCSERCAGRAPGTEGGREARRIVLEALRDAQLDPFEQPVPGCGGANVLARIEGDTDRWVLLAAHYDHLGVIEGQMYRGADDNAAAVAILVQVARRLAERPPAGRGVIIASFDAEEPPHFRTDSMGSERFARQPTVPLERIDMMVCMDLVGHALGPQGLPEQVRSTVFALGAERSEGTLEQLRVLARAEPGVIVRPADAEIIAPMSDYAPFWERRRPFLFLTNGRSRVYHTPDDVPELLDYGKMACTARWLERFARACCERPGGPIAFRGQRNDAATLESLRELLESLAPVSAEAELGLRAVGELERKLRADATLPPSGLMDLSVLIAGVENGLA